MKSLKLFSFLMVLTFIFFSCEKEAVIQDVGTEQNLLEEGTIVDYSPFVISIEKVLTYNNKVHSSEDSRDSEFDPIPYLQVANAQYPEDLIAEFNAHPELASLANWNNIEDFINDPILSSEAQMALTTLFAGFDDYDAQVFLDIAEAAPDDDTAKSQISEELIIRLNEWYDSEAPNLNPEDAADLMEAKMYAESVVPVIVASELSEISNIRKGKFGKWLKKNIKKVVSVVKGVVTGVKKGIKIGKTYGKPVLGGVIGGIIGGGKSLYITWKWNVCWFFGCEQCCNSDDETENHECAVLFMSCPGQAEPLPWENFECKGQSYSFESFKEYCKHFQDQE